MGTGKTYSTKYLLDSNNSSGVAGQVLSTTSTGIDWVDANTVPGTGLWLTNGNDIYNSNSGSVGIGVTSLSDWGWIIDHALQFANGAFVAGRTDSTAAINLGSNAFVTATGGNAWKYFAAGAATRYIQQVGEHYFQTAGVGAAAGDAITWSTALNIANNGNAIFSASTSIGTTVAPTRTLDVRGTGMSIFGTGGYTELMLRGQVEGTGTVRNVGSWHWSVRSDVGGDNDDLKLLRFETGTFKGTSMQISNSTGNIGIGVNATPDANYRLTLEDTNEDILRLHNSTDGLDALISFTNPGGTLGRIQGIDNGGLGFDTGNNAGGINTNAMFINNSGNVGIGTTSPAGKLDVVGSLVTTRVLTTGSLSLIGTDATASAQTVLTISTGVGNATGPNIVLSKSRSQSSGAVVANDPLGTIKFQGGNGTASVEGARIQSIAGSTWSSTNRDSDLLFWTTPSSSTTIAERMRINSEGNVGIGTNSPNDKLNIHNSSANANLGIKITRGSQTHGLRLGVNDSHAFLWTDQNQDLVFATNDSQRVTIQAAGNVGIGTTSPIYKLTVSGGIEAGGLVTYSKVAGSLNTTGYAVAGLIAGFNGASAGFEFKCYGGNSKYQRVVYSCHCSGTTWVPGKVIDEGTNDLDVVASANGATITFTFKARSSTQHFSPRIVVQATGHSINSTYA